MHMDTERIKLVTHFHETWSRFPISHEVVFQSLDLHGTLVTNGQVAFRSRVLLFEVIILFRAASVSSCIGNDDWSLDIPVTRRMRGKHLVLSPFSSVMAWKSSCSRHQQPRTYNINPSEPLAITARFHRIAIYRHRLLSTFFCRGNIRTEKSPIIKIFLFSG